MAIRPRPGGFVPPEGYAPRESGVLVLLYLWDGQMYIPLILRTEDGGSHSGQVSFPGGGQEPGETIEATALREGREEIGVDPASLTVLGSLTPLYIPASGNRIHPLVAYTAERPRFQIERVEVQRLVEAPIALFMDPAKVVEETWHFGAFPVQVPFFPVDGLKVWGATAMVLSELAAVLKEAGYGETTPGCDET